MPSLRQLEYLVALADTRHFRRAAERANTTQPTLSEQIKALEDRLGAQLVERNRSGALMTPTGARVVEIARQMLIQTQEIRAIAAMDDGTPRGVLRLGLPATIGPYLLPLIVQKLRHSYPELKLYAREELPVTLPKSLEDGAYDAIITPLPAKGDDVNTVELFREPLFLTVPAGHPLAQRPRVEREQLKGQEILTLGPGHQLHDVVLSLCEEFGAKFRPEYEGSSLDMLREMVNTGLGITFMPGLYARRELRQDHNLKLTSLHGRAVHRSIGMLWRKSSPRASTFEMLAGLIKDTAQKEFTDLHRVA